MPAVVEQPAKVRLITDAPHHRCLSVTLRYDSADPLAVRVAFPAEVSRDDGEVVWAFARELLEAGLRTPSGEETYASGPAAGPRRCSNSTHRTVWH